VSAEPCEFAQMLGSVAVPTVRTCRNDDANEAREDMNKGIQRPVPTTNQKPSRQFWILALTGAAAVAACVPAADDEKPPQTNRSQRNASRRPVPLGDTRTNGTPSPTAARRRVRGLGTQRSAR
jgi:hypothetical protein